jgi:hypothetical protein
MRRSRKSAKKFVNMSSDAVVKTRATRFDGARNIIEFAVENKISESP